MAEATSWIGDDLPPIMRDGVEYFLLSHRGELYLVPNVCPHRGGPLKFGYVDERRSASSARCTTTPIRSSG